jgi:hypothetical protein
MGGVEELSGLGGVRVRVARLPRDELVSRGSCAVEVDLCLRNRACEFEQQGLTFSPAILSASSCTFFAKSGSERTGMLRPWRSALREALALPLLRLRARARPRVGTVRLDLPRGGHAASRVAR